MTDTSNTLDISRTQGLFACLPRFFRRQRLLATLCRLRILSPIQRMSFDNNARAWVDLRDSGCRGIFLTRYFWPDFPTVIASFLRDGGDFFDVGANYGLITFGALSLLHGQGVRFHLFEANPRIIPLLERSAHEFSGEHIIINHCCVSDTPGVSHLYQPNDSSAYGFISSQGVAVPNLLLDDYVAAHGIERIGFLKMDVEGWELHALRGAKQTLSQGKVPAGFVELAPEILQRNGASAQDLLDLLDQFGFDSYFTAMHDGPDPFGLRWARVAINGTSLRFAIATPIPSSFIQGDVMIIHRSSPHSAAIRAALS